MKLVIDTNLFVSAGINRHSRERLDRVLRNTEWIILLDQTLLAEVDEVLHRPKFSKYISHEEATRFLDLLAERGLLVRTTEVVKVSPDPKDDFLLALCSEHEADYLLTGNKIDLLDLGSFGKTRIITLTDFLALHDSIVL
jgi:uncharacterized protein